MLYYGWGNRDPQMKKGLFVSVASCLQGVELAVGCSILVPRATCFPVHETLHTCVRAYIHACGGDDYFKWRQWITV